MDIVEFVEKVTEVTSGRSVLNILSEKYDYRENN